MIELNLTWAILPLVGAIVANFFAEIVLLYSENRLAIAAAKSAKSVIIPALIAAYALVVAGIIGGPNE